MDFPERLRSLREQKNLTQTELGRPFRLSKQTISAYENGDASPPADTLILMADYFGITVDYLLGRVAPDNPLDQLEGEEREKVLEYASLLLNKQKFPKDGGAGSIGLTNIDRNGKKPRLKRGTSRKTGS